MSTGKHSNNKESILQKNILKKCIILIIILAILIFLIIFNKNNFSNFPTNTSVIFSNNINNDISTDTYIKKVENFESLQVTKFDIDTSIENQAKILITLYNTSEEDFSDLQFNVILTNSDGEAIISYDVSASTIVSKNSKNLTIFTKHDVSQVFDFSISIKD